MGFSGAVPSMTVIGYARISTAEGRQVLHRQLDALNAAGCDRIFEDRGSSAAPKRPNLAACLDYLRSGAAAPVGGLYDAGSIRYRECIDVGHGAKYPHGLDDVL